MRRIDNPPRGATATPFLGADVAECSGGLTLHGLQRAVIIAMVAVRMVEAAVDEVIDMVAVRNRLMPAAGPMDVPRLMTLVAIIRRALVRVSRAHFDDVLIDLVSVLMVEVAIVQVVDVITVLDREVTAVGAVMVGMLGLDRFPLTRPMSPVRNAMI